MCFCESFRRNTFCEDYIGDFELKMYTTKFLKSLINKLNSKISTLECLQEQKMLSQTQETALQICELAQSLAMESRKLPLSVGFSDINTIRTLISNALDINIDIKGDIVSITIPTLLPKKNVKQDFGTYIADSIHTALWVFEQDNPGKITKYTVPVVLIQENCYDNSYPVRLLKDHDNIEKKAAIDAIASVFLYDDAPTLMSNFNYTTKGEVSYTKFTIIPATKFSKFISQIF